MERIRRLLRLLTLCMVLLLPAWGVAAGIADSGDVDLVGVTDESGMSVLSANLEEGRAYITGDKRYRLLYSGSEFIVTTYLRDEKGVIMPTVAAGVPITAIASYAFVDKSLQSIVMPPRLKIVEAKAFSGCGNLRYVVAQNTTKLAVDAFYEGCESITLARMTSARRFYDVTGWPCQYIYALSDLGLVNGRTDTAFEPDQKISRAEFCKIIAVASGENLDTYFDGGLFSDVAADDWYAKYINWAASQKIVHGTGYGKFSPNANITREQIAAIISRYASYRRVTLPQTYAAFAFMDSGSISIWARDAVAEMQRAGIIRGYEDGSFKPAANATRAEASKIIAVYLSIEDSAGATSPREVAALCPTLCVML